MSGNINEGQEEQQGSPNGLNRDSQTSSSSVINERGGYGLTVTEDKTGTLRSTGHIPILNDQGGQCMSVTKNKVNSLLCSTYKHPPITYDMTHPCDVIRVREGAVQTLQARMGTGGNGVPLVKCVAGNLVDRECHMHGVGVKDDCAYTLNTVDKHAITVYPQKSYSEYGKGEPLSSLKNSGGNFGGGSESLVGEPKLRRLTPLECERLQGLPDNWTAVEGASNSARYRAIGNGMAQPCADFIIRRIAEYMRKECT